MKIIYLTKITLSRQSRNYAYIRNSYFTSNILAYQALSAIFQLLDFSCVEFPYAVTETIYYKETLKRSLVFHAVDP